MHRWRHLLPSLPTAWLGRVRWRQLLLEALVALSLAFLAWLYMRSREQSSLDEVEVPVQLTLPASLVGQFQLEVHGPSKVPMSFTGPPSLIRELRTVLQRGLLQVTTKITVPEEYQKEAVYRDVVHIEAPLIPVPRGILTVVHEGRNRIPFTVHRLVERQLPVRFDYAGETRISQLKLEPALVTVRGPQELLERARAISTQPYTLPYPHESVVAPDGLVRGQIALAREIDGVAVQALPAQVGFRFKVHARQEVYELREVPIHFLCPPGFAWKPRFATEKAGKVSLKLVGPASSQPPTVTAFIDLTRGDLGGGRNVEPLRLQLPRDFQLAQDTPQMVAFYLDPLERD